MLRETTLTISDSIETASPVEIKIVRVVSPSTTEITDLTRFKNQSVENAGVAFVKEADERNKQSVMYDEQGKGLKI